MVSVWGSGLIGAHRVEKEDLKDRTKSERYPFLPKQVRDR